MPYETTTRPHRPDVLVVGGGLAGLTAAALIARGGRRVALCERAPTLGGRARTLVREGFHLNLGPHALYRGGAGARTLDALRIDYSGGRPPLDGAMLTAGERRWPLPAGTLDLLRHRRFSVRERAAALRFFVRLQRLDTDAVADVGLDRWLGRQGLPQPVCDLIRALVRLTAYCSDSELVSAGAALAQLRQATNGGVLYLDGGWQTLVDALAKRAREAGATLNTGMDVRTVLYSERGVQALLGDGQWLQAKAAVLAVPPPTALRLLGEAASQRLLTFAQHAHPAYGACLDVGLDRLPRPRVPFALDLAKPLYLSLHSAAARLAPEGRHLLQLLHYEPDRGNAREQLATWLEHLQPGWREHALTERYLPRTMVMSAIPRADQGGMAGRPSPAESGCPNVWLCGDWVGRHGLLSDASFASAREAARLALEHDQRLAA